MKSSRLFCLMIVFCVSLKIAKVDAQFGGLSAKVQKALEEIKKRMCRPIPELGLPALDPFQIKKYYFDADNRLGTLQGEIKKLKATGLKTVQAPTFNLNIAEFGINFEVVLPSLLVTSDYKAAGLIGSLIDINGGGNFSVSMKQCDVKGSLKLKMNTVFNYLYVETIEITPSIKELKVHINGLHPNKKINDFINKALNDLMPEILPMFWEDYKNSIYKMATQMVNQQLGSKSVSDLLFKPLIPKLGEDVCN